MTTSQADFIIYMTDFKSHQFIFLVHFHYNFNMLNCTQKNYDPYHCRIIVTMANFLSIRCLWISKLGVLQTIWQIWAWQYTVGKHACQPRQLRTREKWEAKWGHSCISYTLLQTDFCKNRDTWQNCPPPFFWRGGQNRDSPYKIGTVGRYGKIIQQKYYMASTHINDDFADNLGVIHTVKECHEGPVAKLLLTDLQDKVLERLDDHLSVLPKCERNKYKDVLSCYITGILYYRLFFLANHLMLHPSMPRYHKAPYLALFYSLSSSMT